jgi:pyrroline-5-carboxylate reductase
MSEKFEVRVTSDNVQMLSELKIVFLSVKPQVMDIVLKEIAPYLSEDHLIVSIAAGYSMS